MELIGRSENIRELDLYMASDKAEFIALYGRRRVGKTFLIDSYFKDSYAFATSGVIGGTKGEEMAAFCTSLKMYGYSGDTPRTWWDAFIALRSLLESKKYDGKRRVVFIDELPCLATHKSGFIKALDYFWNSWASKCKDIFLVVCGSATSWIVRNIIDNHGGLHNRITHEMHLRPFNLAETAQYLRAVGADWDDLTIAQTYMILGGVPYYLSLLRTADSLAQNVDRLFFTRDAELRKEYKRLYKSLFKNPEKYMEVIKKISEARSGVTRKELAEALGKDSSGHLTDMLEDLENCDFIWKDNVKQKKISGKNGIYRLTDMYTIFYLEFSKVITTDRHYWSKFVNSQTQSTWWGLAFERLCMDHVEQIQAALGISAVHTEYYSWRWVGDEYEKGAQIDLVIERDDRVINVCEIKYCSSDEYQLDQEERMKIAGRISAFKKHTGTRYGVAPTLITTFGLKSGKHSSYFNGSVVTLSDLLKF